MAKRASSRVTKKSGSSPQTVTDALTLTTLNFKVSQEFHRDFKTFAAQHSKKMVEVLQEAFALLKESDGR